MRVPPNTKAVIRWTGRYFSTYRELKRNRHKFEAEPKRPKKVVHQKANKSKLFPPFSVIASVSSVHTTDSQVPPYEWPCPNRPKLSLMQGFAGHHTVAKLVAQYLAVLHCVKSLLTGSAVLVRDACFFSLARTSQ